MTAPIYLRINDQATSAAFLRLKYLMKTKTPQATKPAAIERRNNNFNC